ncbi:YsnF/AvaK domain-containing protein [Terriglobus sp.]|uniref:YsnF/AvaK domain-containing protein n=1 Tax=Terriglobus sp. TaxID=1889013 RepID=UPI003B00F7F6
MFTPDPDRNTAPFLANVTPGQAASVNVLRTSGRLDPTAPLTELQLEDGTVLRLPTALLQERQRIAALSASDAPADATDASYTGTAGRAATEPGRTVIPVMQEELHVTTRTLSTGTVRLDKTVQTYQTALDEPLAVRTYDIERVVLNQPIDAAPGTRQEGDTTIYPVVEEQAIVTKQLILREEIRVTRRDTERRDQQTVTLRREHVEITRNPNDPTVTS